MHNQTISSSSSLKEEEDSEVTGTPVLTTADMSGTTLESFSTYNYLL